MLNNRFRNITLQQMEALIRLVEEQSFSRAAKKMYLTQPSLTKHIKNLEETIGTLLVDRKSRGISLTPEGKILYEYARRVFKMVDEAKEKIARVQEDDSGSISISASTIPATYILPHVLRDFNTQYPRIRCYVQTNDSDATVDLILDNRAEIGFIGKEVSDRKLHVEAVWKDRLILVVPEGHRWSVESSVTIEDLASEPFIMRERGSATRSVLDDFLQKNLNTQLSLFHIVAELGSSEAVKEAVIAGLGVSILSARAVDRELASGFLIEKPIDGCLIERNFYLIHRKQFNLMRHHELFLDSVRDSEDTDPS